MRSLKVLAGFRPLLSLVCPCVYWVFVYFLSVFSLECHSAFELLVHHGSSRMFLLNALFF